ncbi:MAG: hypothetical protein WCG31_10175, partial [Deltaproteobacteria bacterium]
MFYRFTVRSRSYPDYQRTRTCPENNSKQGGKKAGAKKLNNPKDGNPGGRSRRLFSRGIPPCARE